jgi:hypothetical protein
MATGAYFAGAGNRHYGTYGYLPKIHQEKTVGFFLTEFSLARSEWALRKKAYVSEG